jgi:short-subunit dehydrogenase involved in D-alanine esterification of teichoic acids
MNIQRGTMTSATTPVSGQREPELAGQTVVVIGGSSGIGLKTAWRARAEAADVIIAGRDPDQFKKDDMHRPR